MYAYNLRNKLSNSGWKLDYLSDIDKFVQWLKDRTSAIIFIDTRAVDFSKITPYLEIYRDKIIIVYLDENNEMSVGELDNCLIANSENIDLILPLLVDEYEKKYKVDNINHVESVSDVLSHFGLSPKYKGYSYLMECIELGLMNCGKFIRYSSDIYPIVAKSHNVSTASVEKCVRDAIKKTYMRFPELFNNEDFKFGRATNNEFMNCIIERIRKMK